MCGCLILLELLILSIDFARDAVYSPTHSREQRDTFPVVTRATDIPVLRFPADLSVIQAQVQSHLILLAVAAGDSKCKQRPPYPDVWGSRGLMINLLTGCPIGLCRNALQLILNDLSPSYGCPTPVCITNLVRQCCVVPWLHWTFIIVIASITAICCMEISEWFHTGLPLRRKHSFSSCD